MGEIFEKLLLSNEILSEQELEHYKKIQAAIHPPEHLGKILLDRGLIDAELFEKLQKAEQDAKKQYKLQRKQKKDKKILEVVQKLGIVGQKEIAACIRERREAESKGKQIFLADLFVQKKYLTPYLIRKFYKKGAERIPLAEGVKQHEDLVVNIPQYLRDRFLSRIAFKNRVLSKEQLENCWNSLKKCWPRKALSEIMLEKGLISDKKLKILLNVLQNSLSEAYPHYSAQIRDTQLARLLVKRNFLSPWRLNKSLLKQLEILKNSNYISLRQILVNEGHLCDYQFDVVLRQYGDLVAIATPDFLVPIEDIKALRKEDIEQEIHEAESDVHLIVEEEDIETFDFDENFIHDGAGHEGDLEGFEEIEEFGDMDIDDEPESQPSRKEKKGKGPSDDSSQKEISSEVIYPEIISVSSEKNGISEGSMDVEVEEHDAIEIDWSEENMNDFVVEDLNVEGLELKPDEKVDIDGEEIDELLEEVTLDASEECYAEEMVRDDLKEIEKRKKKKKDGN